MPSEDHHSSAFSSIGLQSLRYLVLEAKVERGGGLVHEEDVGLAYQGLRDLRARAESVPLVLRAMTAAGFGTHLRALQAAGDVAESAARGIGTGLLVLAGFGLFLVLGGKND